MKYRQRRMHRDREPAELNITAFMNLMVVLVPFLLITAVFSRMAILELSLPAPSAGDSEDPTEEQLVLEITVRKDVLEVGDRNTGLLKALPGDAEAGHDLAGLSDYLQQVKARYPEKTDITLLLEPDVEYDVLVQVMDAARVAVTERDGERVLGELFPEISLGDAPPRMTVAKTE